MLDEYQLVANKIKSRPIKLINIVYPSQNPRLSARQLLQKISFQVKSQ
jgi:hypothetical protein